jgi:hypothetical protein
MSNRDTFESVLNAWSVAEEARIVAAERYREAHARAFNAAKGTDTARKAAADESTSALRLDRDFAESKATKLHHRVIFYRGSAGERAREE